MTYYDLPEAIKNVLSKGENWLSSKKYLEGYLKNKTNKTDQIEKYTISLNSNEELVIN